MLDVKRIISCKNRVIADLALAAILALAVIFVFSSPVFAQAEELAEAGAASGLPQTDLISLIGNIMRVVLGLLGIIAVALMIYAGVTWATAGGDSEKVGRAKKIMFNGAIGVVIIASSFALVSFIFNRLQSGMVDDGFLFAGGRDTMAGRLGSGSIYLVVTARTPEPDDSISRNSVISISFNQNLNCETVAPNLRIERDGEDVKGVIRTLGNNIIFKPEGRCPAPLDTLACQDTESCKETPETPCRVGIADNPACGEMPEADPPYEQGSCCPSGRTCCGCFEPGRYRISIAGGKDGIRGTTKHMQADKSWDFEVSQFMETVSPEVVSALPQGDSVARNVGVAVTFTKDLDVSTLKVYSDSLFYENGVSDIAQATVRVTSDGLPISGRFAKMTGKAFIFRPDTPCPEPDAFCSCFEGLKDIDIELVGGAEGIKDSNCNSLDCGNGKCQWSFRTSDEVDLTPPEVSSTEPADEETDVDRASVVRVVFSEIVDPTSVNFDTFQLMGEVAASISVSEDSATLLPFSIMKPETSYRCIIFGGGSAAGGCAADPELLHGIKDLAGNALAEDYKWAFVTGYGVNDGDPLITRVDPEKGTPGQCVTVHGFNLGCCANSPCTSLIEAQSMKWDGKDCSLAPVEGKAEFYPETEAEVLKWTEINRQSECIPPNCPNSCGFDTCNVGSPDNCRSCTICYSSDCPDTCYCVAPPGYSPENEIVVRVPEGATDKREPEFVPERWISPTEVEEAHTIPGEPGEVKITPAY